MASVNVFLCRTPFIYNVCVYGLVISMVDCHVQMTLKRKNFRTHIVWCHWLSNNYKTDFCFCSVTYTLLQSSQTTFHDSETVNINYRYFFLTTSNIQSASAIFTIINDLCFEFHFYRNVLVKMSLKT